MEKTWNNMKWIDKMEMPSDRIEHTKQRLMARLKMHRFIKWCGNTVNESNIHGHNQRNKDQCICQRVPCKRLVSKWIKQNNTTWRIEHARLWLKMLLQWFFMHWTRTIASLYRHGRARWKPPSSSWRRWRNNNHQQIFFQNHIKYTSTESSSHVHYRSIII